MSGVRIGNREVKLTNLDKVFFPALGLTKGDLIQYYLDMAPYVLYQASRRPMQMKRYPDGVDGFFFYQKGSSMQKEHASADTGGSEDESHTDRCHRRHHARPDLHAVPDAPRQPRAQASDLRQLRPRGCPVSAVAR